MDQLFVEQERSVSAIKELSEIFVSPDEKPLAILGKDNLNGFLDLGIPYAGFCVTTDKRMYFKGGHTYQKPGLGYKESNEAQTVDLNAVTGVHFASIRLVYIMLLNLLGIIGFSILTYLYLVMLNFLSYGIFTSRFMIGCSLVVFLLYIVTIIMCDNLKKKEMFIIDYMGGSIAFPVSFYGKEELTTFEEELRQVLDAHASAPDTAKADEAQ